MKAFTLPEVLVTLFVVGLLSVLIFAGVPYWKERSEGVKCVNNMKSLHVFLAAYIQEQGHWPQEPKEFWEANDNNKYEDWWIETLKPYGATEKIWQCPSIARQVTLKSKDGRPKMHYTPTMFDEKPYTPYKWPTQPWLVEIGNMHGRGAMMDFPDGSVRPMMDVMEGR